MKIQRLSIELISCFLLFMLAGCISNPTIVPAAPTREPSVTSIPSTAAPTETLEPATPSPAAEASATFPPAPTATVESEANTTFVERFDDNAKGWALPNDALLSQGKLVVTANRGNPLWLTLPDIEVTGDFTIQADMTLNAGHACSSAMGFAVGEDQISNHSFLFTGGGCGGSEVGVYQNTIERSIAPLIGITLNKNITFPMSLELKNGTYTLYINGDSTVSMPITPEGNAIGVYVWRFNNGFSPGESTYFIDNVIFSNE